MATAFTTSTKSTSSSHYKLYASSSSSENNDERSDKNKNESKSENDAEGNSPLSLPPIGESSYGTIASAFGDENNSQSSIDEETGHKQIILNSDKGTEVAQVGSSKFELQYTCNICETRNSHKVSRLGTFVFVLSLYTLFFICLVDYAILLISLINEFQTY